MAKHSLIQLLSDRGIEVSEVPAGKTRVFRVEFGTTTYKAFVVASGAIQAMKFAGAALLQHDENPHVSGLVHDGLLEQGAISGPAFLKALEMAESGLIRWER